MNAGFENEFYLLKSVLRYGIKQSPSHFVTSETIFSFSNYYNVFTDQLCREGKEEWVPFDSTPYASTSAYDAASPLFQEVVATLHSLNIPVEQVLAKFPIL